MDTSSQISLSKCSQNLVFSQIAFSKYMFVLPSLLYLRQDCPGVPVWKRLFFFPFKWRFQCEKFERVEREQRKSWNLRENSGIYLRIFFGIYRKIEMNEIHVIWPLLSGWLKYHHNNHHHHQIVRVLFFSDHVLQDLLQGEREHIWYLK